MTSNIEITIIIESNKRVDGSLSSFDTLVHEEVEDTLATARVGVESEVTKRPSTSSSSDSVIVVVAVLTLAIASGSTEDKLEVLIIIVELNFDVLPATAVERMNEDLNTVSRDIEAFSIPFVKVESESECDRRVEW
jgi:hypothetical protein